MHRGIPNFDLLWASGWQLAEGCAAGRYGDPAGYRAATSAGHDCSRVSGDDLV